MQCTRLAIDVFTSDDAGTCTAWVTELATGKPVAGAHVTVVYGMESGAAVTTDEHGLCTVTVPAMSTTYIMVAQHGADVAFIHDIRIHARKTGQLLWHVFTDRGVYKPSESVSFKGYVRHLEAHGEALVPVYERGLLHYIVSDPRGTKLHEGHVKLNRFGAFHLTCALPDNVNLGEARVVFADVRTAT